MSPKTGDSPESFSLMSSSEPASLILVIADAILSPRSTKPFDHSLIFPLMFSTPMASMIVARARWIRFLTFSTAVPMPPVADLACSSNEANPSMPSELSFRRALLKSSNVTFPDFIAS